MLAKFCSLEWKDSSTEFITRKPGEKKPTTTCKEYKRNADGSVVYMVTKPNAYLLTLKKEDGSVVTEDVYGVIKFYNRKVRITKNFRAKFEAFMSTRSYSVDDNSFIRGLYNGVEDFFREYKWFFGQKKRRKTSFFVLYFVLFLL